MKRHLALKSEYLSELNTEELALVAAGVRTTDCFTGYYPTINSPCPTDTCFDVSPVLSLNRPCPTLDGCFTGTTTGTTTG